MALVRRGNVELEVHDDFLQQYLSKGFDQIDTSGKVLTKGVGNNFYSLQLAFAELNKEHQATLIENRHLSAENEELKKKIAQLQKKTTTPKTTKE